MDGEYSENVDISADIDIVDTDVVEDIPDDVSEDILEEDYSDMDVSKDISDDALTEDTEYNETDDSIKEDSIELETAKMNESIDDFEEDSYDDLEYPSESDGETDDEIPEDVSDTEETEGSTDVVEVNSILDYMNVHNYGPDDYAEYSQDPIWRELHSAAFPDDELPPLSDETSEQEMIPPAVISDDGGDLNPHIGINDNGNNPPNNPDDITGGDLFGSFETDKHINGSDSFVKGDNYEKFKKDYYSPEESIYEAYDTPKEVDISPSMIEGIHLGESELEDPSVFWSQHERDGTLESFKEIALRVPDVREQLDSGKTMDELLADPELSKCAGIYFANKPEVIENDGYYEFDSNGRHRILAAREAGYDIPVEVIGRRNRSVLT